MNKRKFLSAMVGAGYNQKSLAEKIGISPNSLGNKINGRSFFETRQVVRLCEVLGILDDREKVEIFLTESSHYRDTA